MSTMQASRSDRGVITANTLARACDVIINQHKRQCARHAGRLDLTWEEHSGVPGKTPKKTRSCGIQQMFYYLMRVSILCV